MDQNPNPNPFYLKNKKYQRSQKVRICHNCKDTSFEMLENGKLSGKCCRCGDKF